MVRRGVLAQVALRRFRADFSSDKVNFRRNTGRISRKLNEVWRKIRRKISNANSCQH